MTAPHGLTHRLGRIELADDRGETIRLADTWQDRTVVLAFIRHFG